ncbi:MAG: ABC transporter ATP-binding protein [Alkalilacustris sp.]
MIDPEPWRKAWALLDRRERLSGLVVLLVSVVAALASTVMVASVLPFLSVLSDPQSVETSTLLRWVRDMFGFETAHGLFVGLGLASLVVIVGATALQIANIYVISRFSLLCVHGLSVRMMAQYLSQPYEFFLTSHTGSMSTRILAECSEFVARFLRPAADLAMGMALILSMLAFLLWLNPLITLVAFSVLGGTYGGVYYLCRVPIRHHGAERTQANAARYRLATEALGGVKDIKLLGREASYLGRFGDPSLRFANAQLRVELIAQLPKHALHALGIGGVVLICLALVGPGSLEDGSVAGVLPLVGVLAFAAQRLMPELGRVYNAASMIQSGRAAVDLLHADLVERPAGRLPLGTETPMGLRRELRLEGLSYRYPGAERAGVQDISLALRAGERVGIVGGSGAGKTTLADLLLGLFRPQEGRIVVDGVALDEDNLASWQRSVGYVPQDIFLTDAPVSENIALGVPPEEIDMAKVREAARIASLERFVETTLPEGFATRVGERGVRLSGGQRQRIGIARALYHDADLIVFDEATSALDNLTEREVMQAIEALPGDKTIVMIAHRLSTVRGCDRIIVLSEGQLAAVGPWDELMARSPEFRRLAQLADVA